MLVAFSNGGNVIVTEATVGALSWRLPVTGQAGEASVTVRASSPAYSAAFINPDGGSSIHVLSDRAAGDWHGILTSLDWQHDAVTLSAHEPQALLGSRFVDDWSFADTTAGFIITRALRQTLGGVRQLSAPNLPYEIGGPLIAEYQFSRQSVWDVAVDLMGLCEQELKVDPASGILDWAGALAHTTAYSRPLYAGSTFHDWRYRVDTLERAAEVIATWEGDSYSAYAGEVAASGWPAQAVVSADGPAYRLVDAAQRELARRRRPKVTLTGSVSVDDFSVRCDRLATVVLPGVEFAGVTVRGRVLAREMQGGGARMALTLAVLPEDDTRQLAAVGGNLVRQARGRDARRLPAAFSRLRRRVSDLERSGA